MDLLDLRFVFLIGLDTVHTERNDSKAAELRPFLGKHFIQSLGNFKRVSRQIGIVDALGRNLGKCRLESRKQFRFQLAVNLGTLISVRRVACHIGVKEDRIHDFVTVFTETADTDGQFQSGIRINHLKRNLAGRTVLVPDDFLCVEEINALVFPCITAKGKTSPHLFEYGDDAFLIQTAREEGRFR